MKQALATMAMLLLGGCSMRPDGLNWLPPEAHGAQPSLPTEPGRGGVVYLPLD